MNFWTQRVRKLYDAHLAAHHAGDAAAAARALEELRGIAEQPRFLEVLTRALTNAHCWSGHAKQWDQTEQLLNELRGIARRPEATEPVLTRFAEALFNAHIFARDDQQSRLLCLAELRNIALRPEATEPQRTWLCMALFNHVGHLLEMEPDAAPPILEELRRTTKRSDTSEKQRTQLAMAVHNVARAAAERGNVELAKSLSTELSLLRVGEGSCSAPPLASKILEALAARFGGDLGARANASYMACQRLAAQGDTGDAL